MSPEENFVYKNNILQVEALPLTALAEKVGTPFYCYSETALNDRAEIFTNAFLKKGIQPYFAVKANSNLAVINLFAKHGFGADIVSAGELSRALKAGVAPDKIVFSGVGKRDEELAFALESGIHQINLESAPELERLSAIAKQKNVLAIAALRIKPNVSAGGHDKISTGRAHDKFGVSIDEAPEVFSLAKQLGNVDLKGLAIHIGSQINTLQPYKSAYQKIAILVVNLQASGYEIDRLDLGGGFGIAYKDEVPLPVEDYAKNILEVFGSFKGQLGIEPGRALVGNCGILVTRILYIKESSGRKFAVIDAAMNDLMRPSLYEAWHKMLPVQQADAGSISEAYDIVGPICETGDRFAIDRFLPPVRAGNYLAIMSAGAYGATMSSTYNTRPLIPEIMVKGSEYSIIRRRIEVDELLSYESIPEWPIS